MMVSEPVSRRRCLQGIVGAAVGVAAGQRGVSLAAWAAETQWTMRMSASSIAFNSLPLAQACERIAALGFEAIDIWGPIFNCTHLVEVEKGLGAEGLKALLEKNRLRLFSFSVYGGGVARFAELLGKCGGGVAIRGSGKASSTAEMRENMKKFLEAMKPEAELAEKHGFQIAIENHGGALLNTVGSLKAFVELNHNPRLGIALAPYHIEAGKESVVDAIHAAGPQLLYFYAWQHASGVQQLPGHGTSDMVPWIQALADVRYRGYVNPFLHHEPSPDETYKALEKSRDYLKDCYAKAMKS